MSRPKLVAWLVERSLLPPPLPVAAPGAKKPKAPKNKGFFGNHILNLLYWSMNEVQFGVRPGSTYPLRFALSVPDVMSWLPLSPGRPHASSQLQPSSPLSVFPLLLPALPPRNLLFRRRHRRRRRRPVPRPRALRVGGPAPREADDDDREGGELAQEHVGGLEVRRRTGRGQEEGRRGGDRSEAEGRGVADLDFVFFFLFLFFFLPFRHHPSSSPRPGNDFPGVGFMPPFLRTVDERCPPDGRGRLAGFFPAWLGVMAAAALTN